MNQKGFAPLIIIVIAIFVIGVGAGGFSVLREKKIPSSEKTVQQEVSSQKTEGETQLQKTRPQKIEATGLGNLCSGEKECISFCLNNRGRCENYCKGNKIELCKIIFSPEQQSVSNASKKQDCVSNPKPVFTADFTDITKVQGVSQMGNNALVNPGSQARSYVFVKEGENTPVYAPIDATITIIYYSDKNYSFVRPGFIRPEYRIDFQISCEVRIAYDHIVSIAPRLKEYAPQVSSPGRNKGNSVSIPVQAGELIGYTSGSFPGRAFDFLILNTASPAWHLNPSRWITDHSRYQVCPYDYFLDEVKQRYYALIDKENGAHSCGPRVKEVPKTIAGYWFQGDATESNGPRFVIYGTNHFVEWTLIKSSESPVAFRTHDADFMLPETITEGKSACYYDNEKNTHIYLKMLANEKLGFVSGNGQCSSGFPTVYETWVR